MPALIKDKKTIKKEYVFTCLCSVLVTAWIILIAYIMLGFAPFGDQAFLYKDGQQQMIDLFCWYKDVLSGKSSVDYTFTKYLGGSGFAVFSYYLASPFNLLIVFFDKSQASLFMNVVYLLKAAFAALFASYYLIRRFHPETRSKCFAAVILASSYALSHYMISQSTNSMWLDGVYMLPLILAGVEKLVSEKKSTLFIVSTGLSLIFNWYVGIINLMFSGLWFLFEAVRVTVFVNADKKKIWKNIGFSILRFALACISALMISCVILLPTLTLLSGRSYGHSGISMLTDFSMIGFIPNVVSNYSFGFVSVKGSVNLFAGCFALLGTVLLFCSPAKKAKEKILYGILLLTVVLSFYWQPLVALFSMLREVESLWYRYSYAGSFALIYLAAVFYLECGAEKTKIYIPPIIAVVYSVIVMVMTKPDSHSVAEVLSGAKLAEILGVQPDYYMLPLVSRIMFPLLASLVLSLDIWLKNKEKPEKKIGAVLLSFILIPELMLGQLVLGKVYSTNEEPLISNYTKKEMQLLDSISDTSFYRVVQTSYHSQYHELAASYSEPMAYGFNSVTSFVSAPDESSIAFLDRAGYPAYYVTIPVTTSENLALDSLLAVKYVLLPSGDANNAGLTKKTGIEGFKDLYENPYAVPPAFVISRTGSYDSNKTVPALYLNDMYKHLSGIDEDIFIAVDESSVICINNSQDYTYLLNVGEDEVVYANLVTDTISGAKLYLNGEEYTSYSEDMAPTMVRITPIDGQIELKLEFKDSENPHQVTDAQFYILNTAALKNACDIMKNNAVSKTDIHDGHCRFEINNASAGESLFTSIPYQKGWSITRNGKKINCDLTGDTFITVPLEDGSNVIEMNYSVPNLGTGIIAAVLGIALLAGIAVFENRKNKINN